MGAGASAGSKKSKGQPMPVACVVAQTANHIQDPTSMANSTKPIVDKEAIERSQRIDRELAKARNEESKTIKLLLLGGAESGKSTIVKQMKILHLNGFSESELINYRYLIYANEAMALNQILRAIDELKIVPNGISKEDVDIFKSIASGGAVCNYDLTPELGAVMQRIWTSQAAQECYERRKEFELLDSAKYYLDDLERISSDDYKPSPQDIVRTRAATVGIYEINFQFKGYYFRMVDVGGQKTERRKWIHCFDNVTAILFISSMSEYDQTLAEERNINRMHDSLALFKSIASNSYFTKTSVILFLNKKDIFAEKIATSPLTICFPDYQGPNRYEEASEYILQEYRRRKPADKTFYNHFTMATDTKNVEIVFAASMDTILKKTLSNIGVY